MDMVFTLRKLRTIPVLQRFKVVIVTDRTDLEDQLAETATLCGQTLQTAASIKDLANKLRQPGPGLVFGMIQKFRRITGSDDIAGLNTLQLALNPSEEILLLIDEAHRSHSSSLHAYLAQALPNCAKIGFTGTPIISTKKKRTTEIFGSYIDVYSIRDSQKDKVTVPILYWDARASALVSLAQSERADQSETDDALGSNRNRAFFNALMAAIASPTEQTEPQIRELATTLSNFISQRTQLVGFWEDDVSRDNLRKEIWLKLEDSLLFSDSELDGLADQMIQLADRHASNRVQ
jgi:type I site-specific restriction-modification system R (restriction) subunit